MKNLVLLALLLSATWLKADQPQIVLLRTYLSTNHVEQFISGGGEDLIPVIHPAHTDVLTNYILGFHQGSNDVELIDCIGAPIVPASCSFPAIDPALLQTNITNTVIDDPYKMERESMEHIRTNRVHELEQLDSAVEPVTKTTNFSKTVHHTVAEPEWLGSPITGGNFVMPARGLLDQNQEADVILGLREDGVVIWKKRSGDGVNLMK